MSVKKRTVYFISDGTGITAEGLGLSLLSQFDEHEFDHYTLPYVDSEAKAERLVSRINKHAETQQERPIIFDTIVNRDVRDVLSTSNAFMVDIFDTFLKPLEVELGTSSSHSVGKSHAMGNNSHYINRIEAVNYALINDDGVITQNYTDADIILAGVSRSGKTPTCLYLALQFGVKAANYPLTEEDLDSGRLPDALRKNKKKVFGLTIAPERLTEIRTERRPDSRYASLKQCETEVKEFAALFREQGIPMIDTTRHSVEEIATRILAATGLRGGMNFV